MKRLIGPSLLIFVAPAAVMCLLLTVAAIRWTSKPALEYAEEVSAADLDPGFSADRSSKWATVRKKFIQKNPVCAACGSAENLNVHHIQPFHVHPELELEESNLITLCGPKGRNCHFLIGHDPDGPWAPAKSNWKSSNPSVREHCYRWRSTADRLSNK